MFPSIYKYSILLKNLNLVLDNTFVFYVGEKNSFHKKENNENFFQIKRWINFFKC